MNQPDQRVLITGAGSGFGAAMASVIALSEHLRSELDESCGFTLQPHRLSRPTA